MKLPALSLLVIRVAEPKTTAELYETLGLRFTLEQHGTGPDHYSTFASGVLLELYPASTKNPATGQRFGFNVCSLKDVFESWIKAGGKAIAEPAQTEFGFRAVLEDFDGNKIELTQTADSH